ncbi:MAG: hypothetical protein HY445_02605 [Candidatus Niyogibacteria bacterium]|nr:hypothetical protein [Candidatus Niyogibacteria bacterium]
MVEKKDAGTFEQELEAHLRTLIKDGILHNNEVKLLEQISAAFWQDMINAEYEFTAEKLEKIINRILWTEGPQGTIQALTDIVSWKSPLEKYQKAHPYNTMERIEKKAKEITGLTKTPSAAKKFVYGIGRISETTREDEEFAFPDIDFRNPYHIQTENFQEQKIMFVNGANIGTRYKRDIVNNPVRQASACANKNNVDVVVASNLLRLDTKKAAGPSKALRALFSGREISVSILEPSYQKEALRIIKEHPDDEVIYETIGEAFENLIHGWIKITVKPDGDPEFTGKIIICLGVKEELIILADAYWNVRYYTLTKLNQIKAELKSLYASLAFAESFEDNEAEIAMLKEEIVAMHDQEARTRITDVTDEEWQRFVTRSLSYVVRKLEKAIPHSKVICKGTSYVKVHDTVIETHISSHVRVTDTLLSDYTKTCGPKVLRQELADAVVILHPHALNYRTVSRERDYGGHRGKPSNIYVAPMCVDGRFLRKAYKNIVNKKADPIAQAVYNEQFQPGVLQLTIMNGVVNEEVFSIESLQKECEARLPITIQDDAGPAMPALEGKYINVMVATDPHIGSPNREFIWCKELERNIGPDEAVFHLLRSAGYGASKNPPFHMVTINDDPDQGDHFEIHKQPHRHQMRYTQLEQEAKRLMERVRVTEDRYDLLNHVDAMRQFFLEQIHRRGEQWYTDQLLEFFRRNIRNNIDMYEGVLLRHMQAGIELKGVSELTGSVHDRIDIAAILMGTGNHDLKTTNGHFVPGPINAEYLKGLLWGTSRWIGKENELDKLVNGPVYGNNFIAWGTLKAPGGYEYGLDFRNSPPGGSINWGDPLQLAVRNYIVKGNPSTIFENKLVVAVVGDKHFKASIVTCMMWFVMGPPNTRTDGYGEKWSLPPNNTGVMFVCLPAEGPENAPLITRTLMFHDIVELIQKKKEINWETFFPKPL